MTRLYKVIGIARAPHEIHHDNGGEEIWILASGEEVRVGDWALCDSEKLSEPVISLVTGRHSICERCRRVTHSSHPLSAGSSRTPANYEVSPLSASRAVELTGNPLFWRADGWKFGTEDFR
jgi:hypothetical protein